MSRALAVASINDIASCTDAEILLNELLRLSRNILENLERMAAVIKRLDELRVEVDFNNDLVPYLRMIGNGELTAMCFLACAHDTSLLVKAMSMPSSVQDKIGNGDAFEVLLKDGTTKKVSADKMRPNEVKQVFSSQNVRGIDAQKHWLEVSANRSTARKQVIAKRDAVPRCTGCGARLLPGAECIACKNQEDHCIPSMSGDYEDEDEEEPAVGWQARLSELRDIKISGDELGFHVDWIIRFCDGELSRDACICLKRLSEAIDDALSNRV